MTADVTALIGISLLLSCGVSLVARRFDLPRAARVGVVVAAGAAALLPLGGIMLAGYLRAALGDLSIVTQALLALGAVQYVTGKLYLAQRERTALTLLVVAGAIFLYPATLGLTYFDPYALGYASPWFAGGVLALALAAWYLRLEWLMALIVLAVVARLANALESRNLWDYLIDPWLVLYALLWLIFRKRGAATQHPMART